MRRTAQFIEEHKAAISRAGTGKKKADKTDGRGKHPNSRKGKANLKPPWSKGVSGNPSGLPGTDLAAVAARRFFEAHPEGISAQMSKDMKGFNAYGFSVLADRAYGKVKDRIEHTGPDGGPVEVTVRLIKPKLSDMA
jgi:hypothetical protein